MIVIVDNTPQPPSRDAVLATAKRLQEEKKLTTDLPAIIEEGGMRDDYEKRGAILTDDYAPTDVLRSMPRD